MEATEKKTALMITTPKPSPVRNCPGEKIASRMVKNSDRMKMTRKSNTKFAIQ